MPSMQSPEPPERCFNRWSRPRNPGAARPRPRAPEHDLGRASVSPEAIPLRLAEKLNLRKELKVRVLGKPPGDDLDDVTTTNSTERSSRPSFSTDPPDA